MNKLAKVISKALNKKAEYYNAIATFINPDGNYFEKRTFIGEYTEDEIKEKVIKEFPKVKAEDIEIEFGVQSFKNKARLHRRAKLGKGLSLTKKAFLNKKASEYAEMPMVEFIELLDERLKYANDLWGSAGSEELAQAFSDFIADVGNNRRGVMDLADNYVINGEFVEKAEFTADGNWKYYFKKYAGDWDALCQDALAYNDNFALMRF